MIYLQVHIADIVIRAAHYAVTQHKTRKTIDSKDEFVSFIAQLGKVPTAIVIKKFWKGSKLIDAFEFVMCIVRKEL